MPSRIRRTVLRCPSAAVAAATTSRSPSPTGVSASRAPTRSACSSGSSGWTRRARAPPAGRGWAWRSSSTWPPTTTGRSGYGANPAPVRRSPCRSPPTPTTMPPRATTPGWLDRTRDDRAPSSPNRRGTVTSMTSVLIVEDEESLADPLAFLLRKEGFEATVVTDGPSALAEFDRSGADIVLLDLMLPGMSGTDVCKQLRSRSSVPVIMVTARDSEIDKVVGLELGADDYVTKPYSARELIARIRAVLRRGNDNDDSGVGDGILEAGPVRMDVERHVVSVNGEAITLPLKEFDLLEYLMRNSGRVLTRGQLIDRVWGADYVGDTKTLDVHVKRLRSKIEADPANPVHLVTVRGLGYKLEG